MENKRIAIIISPNYKDYAEKYLPECIESLRKQDYQGEMKIFMTDNATSQESFGLLSKIVPEAELVLNKDNDGFAKGNNDAIKLALAQGFDYVFLVNMDTITDVSCVSRLTAELEKDEKIGAVQPRIMLHPETGRINSIGNDTHFLGFGYCRGYKKWLKEVSYKNKDIFYPSGAGVMFRAKVLKEIGLFDEEMWMYNEDQDLGWRVWLAGYRCALGMNAIVYHKYEFSRSTKKYYWMDRNRVIAIIKNYHALTLLLILPAFIVMELGLFLFSFKSGWLKEKLKMYGYFLSPAKWVYLYKARKQTQALRKIKDSDIVDMISGRIWYQEIDDVKLRLVNPVFDVYWRVVRQVIKIVKF